MILDFVLTVALQVSSSAVPPADVPELAIKATPARGAFFALSVPDAEASARWYERTLGLKVVSRPPGTDTIKVLILEGEGVIVELIQSADAKERRDHDPQRAQGLFKAGFIVDDFDAALARFASQGVKPAYGPFPAKDGQRANFIVRDNTGNLIQVFGKERG